MTSDSSNVERTPGSGPMPGSMQHAPALNAITMSGVTQRFGSLGSVDDLTAAAPGDEGAGD